MQPPKISENGQTPIQTGSANPPSPSLHTHAYQIDVSVEQKVP